MNNKERILESVRYIESNLTSELSVVDIAKEGCCSLYHFIRLFQNITGISPKKYLLQRRLTASIDQLRNTTEKIVSIAYNYQFGSHEVYTRSFQRQFGVSPSKVRKGAAIAAHLLTLKITEDYIFQSKEARNQPPELIEIEEKKIVGISYFISGDLKDLDLSVQWNTFMKMVPLIHNKTKSKDYYQIQYWSNDQEVEGMHIFIGMEVNDLTSIKPQFVIKIIPSGTYLKFIHKGLSRNVGYTYRYIYNEFLPETDYKLLMPFNFEHYGTAYLSPNKEQSESALFIPIVM